MSQSYPWLKLPHREYLVSLTYKVLKPVERLAFIELVMFAHTQEKNALPDNDKFLAAWAGMSLKQWQKIKTNVLIEWSLVDGFWHLPNWFVIEQPTKDINQDDTQDNNKQDDISAKRSAAAKARWAAKNANDDASNASALCKTDANDMQNANLHDAKVMQNDANANFAYANEGGKGGDLDLDLEQDLDKNQYINSHSLTREAEKKSSLFFDDELRPDVNALNAKLGANLITQKFIDENLFSFNAHYETQQLTDNQRLAKWINWFKGEEAKKQAQTIQRPKSSQPTNQVPVSKHGGFAQRDYSVGINEDGSF